MKNLIVLTATVCYLTTVAAMASDAPGSIQVSPPQPPVAGTASPVPGTISAGQETSPKAYSIDALYKNMEALNKQKVIVQGEVVKVTNGIMGKNWIHIQEGIGDRDKGTNDLICISSTGSARVGERVTVIGTVVFNAKSRYKLVIENANIGK